GANAMVSASNSLILGSNANIGIGTSSPTQKLEVSGAIYSSTGGFKFPDGSIQTRAITNYPAFDSIHVVNKIKIGNSIWLGGISQPGSNDIFSDNGDLLLQSDPSISFNTIINANNIGNVGIGTVNPIAKLDISTTAIAGMENLFRATVDDAGSDFFELRNGTNVNGQFIPTLWGHHETNTRQALFLLGEITATGDAGASPVMTFDARRQGGTIQTRPLFSWESFNIPKMTIMANGNIGIGTSNPQAKLHIKASEETYPDCTAKLRLEFQTSSIPNGCGSFHSAWDISASGANNLYFSTPSLPNPVMTLSSKAGIPAIQVNGSISILDPTAGTDDISLLFGKSNAAVNSLGKWAVGYAAPGSLAPLAPGGLNFWIPAGTGNNFGNNYLFLSDNGNIGIGTPCPQNKLDVTGTIRAYEWIVENFSGCDFVFEDNYKRMNYKEKEKYFKVNKHLKGIAPAKETDKNGLKAGEAISGIIMNLEENSLDIIDLQKENETLKKEVNELKKQMLSMLNTQKK
ncbi:MAG: hypothetical protein EPN85_09300, partial [Bacteroidetes bacterium]